MDNAMVTGRMSTEKKAAGAKVLAKAGLNASQAVNLMYDKLEQEQSAEFLVRHKPEPREWESAARFLDSLYMEVNPRFEGMSRSEIRLERAKIKGLI